MSYINQLTEFLSQDQECGEDWAWWWQAQQNIRENEIKKKGHEKKGEKMEKNKTRNDMENFKSMIFGGLEMRDIRSLPHTYPWK
jgi:hypothetical protein